jgi:hypothetical protein
MLLESKGPPNGSPGLEISEFCSGRRPNGGRYCPDGGLIQAGNSSNPPQPSKSLQWYTAQMRVEEIAEAVATLPPDQLARFRRWFTAFEAGRTNHAEELDSSATKLGRLAGRAFAELKRRVRDP